MANSASSLFCIIKNYLLTSKQFLAKQAKMTVTQLACVLHKSKIQQEEGNRLRTEYFKTRLVKVVNSDNWIRHCMLGRVVQWQSACPRTKRSAVQPSATTSCCEGELFTYIQLLLLILASCYRRGPLNRERNAQQKQTDKIPYNRLHVHCITYTHGCKIVREKSISYCSLALFAQMHCFLQIFEILKSSGFKHGKLFSAKFYDTGSRSV